MDIVISSIERHPILHAKNGKRFMRWLNIKCQNMNIKYIVYPCFQAPYLFKHETSQTTFVFFDTLV